MGKIINYAGGAGAEQDTDVNSAGTIIGLDELNFTVTGTTLSADITFDLNGGFLYGTIQITPGHPATSPVTGGTGSFAGATGTITGTVIAKKKEAVTITCPSMVKEGSVPVACPAGESEAVLGGHSRATNDGG